MIPDYPLPADVPTDWQANQIVSPNGTEAGLDEQHGYNYMCAAINAAQGAINNLVLMANSITADDAELTAGSLALTISAEAQHGMTIKFEAPCDSADISVGITINDVLYGWKDTIGEDIAGMEGLFTSGCMVGIIIDRDALIAYLATAAPAKGYIEYTGEPPEVMVSGALYGEIAVDYGS